MFTRCPGCHTVHPLNAALLAQGGGQYRCGKCNKLNQALDALFDEWPDAGAKPHAKGPVPELGMKLDLEAARQDAIFADDDGEPIIPSDHSGKSRWVWITAATLVLIITVVNVLHYFREPLLENPRIQRGMVEIGLQESVPEPEPVVLDSIELVSSEMRNNPQRPGILRLSATLNNTASQRQPYPDLEVVLMNSTGQALARRVFRPNEYLALDADIAAGMAGEAYLPVVLNLSDPGQQAVGFEIQVR